MAPSKRPTSVDRLDGVTKAAILLLSLDHDAAAELLRHLPADLVRDVTRTLASLDQVPAELSQRVIEEFYTLRMSALKAGSGGVEGAADSGEHGRADPVSRHSRTPVPRRPFSFLENAARADLLPFIQDEHPQTIALIIAHLSHRKASEILEGLPPEQQIEVVRRVAGMEQTSPEVIEEVERGLESRLSGRPLHRTGRVGGVATIAGILDLCDRTTEKAILAGIKAGAPELVEEIRRCMFVFEDILEVDDGGIQRMLEEVDDEDLCLALRTASEELREKLFRNMPQRAGEMVRQDMEHMRPVRLSDVEAARQRIVDAVRRLEEAGAIVISGRSDRDVV